LSGARVAPFAFYLGRFTHQQTNLDNSAPRFDRTGAIAFGVYDTEEPERFCAGRAKLVGLVGSDVNRIHRSELKFPVSDLHAPTAAEADDHMCMMVAFQAREASRFEFKVAHMELHLLAQVSNQDLARCSPKLAAPMCGELVWLQFDTVPAEARFKPPDGWWVSGAADTLARHGFASRRCRLCTVGAEGDHYL
jgi:hypothetical protein